MGAEQHAFELSTGGLEIDLPPDLVLPDEGTLRLTWQSRDGAVGAPLDLWIGDQERWLGSRAAGDLRCVFGHVPLHAASFELLQRRGGAYTNSEWQSLGRFGQVLLRGVRQRVQLR